MTRHCQEQASPERAPSISIGWKLSAAISLCLLLAGLSQGCGRASLPHVLPAPDEGWSSADAPVRLTRRHVLKRIRHDGKAFTQGLFFQGGDFIEGTGRLGRSSIRRLNGRSGRTKLVRNLDPELFGEGCSEAGSDIVMLTWRNRVALRFEPDSLELTERLSYSREGWGLTFDGERLIASDGSSVLYSLDPENLETLERIKVKTSDGKPVPRLNELEWVEDLVLANIFLSDLIVAINPKSGIVAKVWDFSEITKWENPSDPEHVLNGIAYDPETGNLWITGKCWKHIYQVALP